MASHTLPLSHGRRLFELLDQQQEPFLLDVFLLENGCSRSSLKSDTPMKFWPMNTCKKLLVFSSYGIKKGRGRKLLNCLLPKIVHWKLLRKALNCYIRSPALWTKRFFKKDDARFWNKVQDTRQLSPVSILELHSGEGCCLQNHSSYSILNSENTEIPFYSAGFSSDSYRCRESSSNALLQSEQLLLQCVKQIERRVWETNASLDQREVFSMKKERRNVRRIGLLIEEDNFNSRTEWNYFQADKREIGMEIENFIFENIKEDSVAEMLRSSCMLERG